MTDVLTVTASPEDVTAPRPFDASWHTDFLNMLPKIKDHAAFRFRHLRTDHREEHVQEAVANACAAYQRLAERRAASTATWSSLAKYAIRQVWAGRRVGSSLNKKDVSSVYCQAQKGVRVESLYRWDDAKDEWHEMVVEDRHLSPADAAAFRIDFGEFLGSLSRRNRHLALLLAKGHTTSWVARKFRLSAGRISQIRKELFEAWQAFQAEPA